MNPWKSLVLTTAILLSGCAGDSHFEKPDSQTPIEACEISLLTDGGSISMCFKVEGEIVFLNWNGGLGSERPCTFDAMKKGQGDEYASYKIEKDSKDEEAIVSMLDKWLDSSPRQISSEFQSERDIYESTYTSSINRIKELIKSRATSPYCKSS